MLFGWFSKNKKDNTVQVTKQKVNMLQNAAAAAAFAEAGEHETARNMIQKAETTKKILVIGREDNFSTLLTDYAVSMAKRLGSELVALNVSNAPLSLTTTKKEEVTVLFHENAKKNVTTLKEQAEKNNIPFCHIIEIGDQDAVVDSLYVRDSAIRYVLTEPDPEVVKKAEGRRISIPVFDLGCYQRAA